MASISRSELNQLIQKLLLSEISSDAFEFSKQITPSEYRFALPLRVTHKNGEFYFEVSYESLGFSMDDSFVTTCFPGSSPTVEPDWFPGWTGVT